MSKSRLSDMHLNLAWLKLLPFGDTESQYTVLQIRLDFVSSQFFACVHGRRKLVELEDYFPNESAQVIKAIAKVYKHEAECKAQRLTPDQRLA